MEVTNHLNYFSKVVMLLPSLAFLFNVFLRGTFLSKQKLIQETSIVTEKIVLLYPSTLGLLGNC